MKRFVIGFVLAAVCVGGVSVMASTNDGKGSMKSVEVKNFDEEVSLNESKEIEILNNIKNNYGEDWANSLRAKNGDDWDDILEDELEVIFGDEYEDLIECIIECKEDVLDCDNNKECDDSNCDDIYSDDNDDREDDRDDDIDYNNNDDSDDDKDDNSDRDEDDDDKIND